VTDAVSTHDQLIAAAVEAAATHGIARLSMSDVARVAGVSRQTLYKHFPSKDALVTEAVLAQAQEMTAEVVLATTPFDDPLAAIEAGVSTILRITAEHPLLHRLIRTEPESLLPILITGDSPIVQLVKGVVEDVVRRDHPELDEVTSSVLADMGSRLLVSYAVNPPAEPPAVVASIIAHVLAGAAGSASVVPIPMSPSTSAAGTSSSTEPALAEEPS
jgi:AcrR family transcriptional regulator